MIKIIIFILEIVGVSLVLDIIGGIIMLHMKNKGVKNIAQSLEMSLKLSDFNYKFNEANGEDNENVYVFKDLPHDIQKIIIEYIPTSFYSVLGDDAYDFLNNMTSDRILNAKAITCLNNLITK